MKRALPQDATTILWNTQEELSSFPAFPWFSSGSEAQLPAHCALQASFFNSKALPTPCHAQQSQAITATAQQRTESSLSE